MTIEIKRVDGTPGQYELYVNDVLYANGSFAECIGVAVHELIERSL